MRLHVPITLRWADLDAYGHVNNAVMLRLLEEARIQAFWKDPDAALAGTQPAGGAPASGDEPAPAVPTAVLDAEAGSATWSLIARQEIEYLAPIPYLRRPLDIQLWIGRLGGASLEVCYEVWSPRGQSPAVLYARASTTVVVVDSATQRPRRLTDDERAAWSPYLEAAPAFSRR